MRLTNNWIHGDCLKELKKLPDESVDLIITSPPYHNLRVYSNDPCDLSNCESYEEYYYMLGLVVAECERVLKPGCKFCIVYEDYNYTIGRDGKVGQESITGDINKIFLNNGFALHTKIINEKYTAQRSMISNGMLYYRNMRARDNILAANHNFVYVYKKQGDCPLIKASDVTLAEWAEWASGVWHCPVSSIGHTTPMSEEMTKRCIKLWSNPLDTVLDPFCGCGCTNKMAILNHRNAIGIELNKQFYDLAKEEFDKWEDDVYETDDNPEEMLKRFEEQLNIGKLQNAKAKEAKEEKQKLTKKKKDIREEIKELESQLVALGMKKSEIKKLKDKTKEEYNAKRENS